MGGQGHIAGMIASLKRNNRRKKREHFNGQSGVKAEKTQYNFPEVAEHERLRIVRNILRKRRRQQSIAMISLILVIIIFLLWINNLIVTLNT